MKYMNLLNFYETNMIIKPEDVYFFGNIKTVRPQLSKWAKSGKLIELRKGYYLLPKKIKKYPPHFYIANTIYFPSYISLQSALSFYGLIPEAVYSITSVSTRKTYEIKNKLGNFIYRQIKKELFFGYKLHKINDFPVLIAEPEKAIIDLIYLSHSDTKSFRLQNHEILNKQTIKLYLKKYPKWVNKKIEEIL